MGTIFVDTGGAATNSGTSDNNNAKISGVSGAGTGVAVSGTTVTFPALTDLSAVVTTAGATQDAIYIADATNTNQKIFWITGVSGSGGPTPTATVSVAPTGTITTSQWAVGGRFVWINASVEAAVRAGDVVQFNNSVASQAGVVITTRVSGDSTSGFIRYIGVAGSRPVLVNTGNNNCIATGAFILASFENLELQQTNAASATVGFNASAAGCQWFNLKLSDGGTSGGFSGGPAGNRIIGCEVSGIGGVAGMNINAIFANWGNYIHDLTGDGFIFSGNNIGMCTFLNNIVDTVTGRGVYWNGAPTTANNGFSLIGNTIYACGNSGFEANDADAQVVMINNIFMNNGDAAGEYNVEWTTGSIETVGFHGWNVFYQGGGSAGNLLGLTVNAQVANSEFITDPGFTSASGGDFSISSSSPAYKTGFPGQFLGGSLGYLSIGAVQPNPTGGSGSSSMLVHPGMSGGMRG